MEKEEYTVKELCEIFNININSFPGIAKKIGIDTSEYFKRDDEYRMSVNDKPQGKKYYNVKAYKKLEKYITEKNKKTNVKEKEIGEYLQKIENLNLTLTTTQEQLKYMQALVSVEKQEKQDLQNRVYNLEEENKKIFEFTEKNKNLVENNEQLRIENDRITHQKEELIADKVKLEEELKQLKNRGFWARIFNK